MELIYSQHQSEIVEFLAIPFHVREETDGSERTQKEQDILKEAFLVQKQLELVFEDMSERLSTYLFGAGFSLLHYLYFELLEEGHDPQTIEGACLLFADSSVEMIERAIRYALLDFKSEQYQGDAELLELLEEIDMKPERKWHWFQAIRKPLEMIQQQIEIVQAVIPLYRPYYEQFQLQREEFAAHFSYEEFYSEYGVYASGGVEELGYHQLRFIVLSPWLVHLSYLYNPEYHHYPVVLLASVDIDKVLFTKDTIDEDLLTTILKVMSDETRYKVMVALTKPYAKSKDIAENLSISGAAVSFHTQKLINAQLLLFNSEDKSVKFDVNKGLLREMIDKLTEDFDL